MTLLQVQTAITAAISGLWSKVLALRTQDRGQITQEISDAINANNNSVGAATGAALAAEVTARTTADTALTQAVSDEQQARIAEDGNLLSSLGTIDSRLTQVEAGKGATTLLHLTPSDLTDTNVVTASKPDFTALLAKRGRTGMKSGTWDVVNSTPATVVFTVGTTDYTVPANDTISVSYNGQGNVIAGGVEIFDDYVTEFAQNVSDNLANNYSTAAVVNQAIANEAAAREADVLGLVNALQAAVDALQLPS